MTKKSKQKEKQKPGVEKESNTQLQQAVMNTRCTPSTSSEKVVDIPLSESQAPDSGVLGGSLFSWVKETVANSHVLSKVAEKAKSSVNSMITTLDPQMREFICKLIYL